MKNIVIVFGLLGVIVFAWLGITYIFEMRTMGETVEMLIKTEGALLLLAACAAVIHKLVDLAKK